MATTKMASKKSSAVENKMVARGASRGYEEETGDVMGDDDADLFDGLDSMRED